MTKHCASCGTHIHTNTGLCHHCRNAKPQQISLEHRTGYCVLCEIIKLSRADTGSVCMFCAEEQRAMSAEA